MKIKPSGNRKLTKSFLAATMLLGTLGVGSSNVAQADDAAAEGPAVNTVTEVTEDVQQLDELLGDQTATAPATSDLDTSLDSTVAGTDIDVPRDPDDGIEVDLAGGGPAVTISPAEQELGDFSPTDEGTAAAAGEDFTTVAQPLADGDFRLAVVLDGPSAPTDLSYTLELPTGTTAHQRDDGGFDFVDESGVITGGLGAPWGVDAAGQPVMAYYTLAGQTITRHILASESAVYPVTSNFCLFGKLSNGRCRFAKGARKWTFRITFAASSGLVCGALAAGSGGAAGYVCGIGATALGSAVEDYVSSHGGW